MYLISQIHRVFGNESHSYNQILLEWKWSEQTVQVQIKHCSVQNVSSNQCLHCLSLSSFLDILADSKGDLFKFKGYKSKELKCPGPSCSKLTTSLVNDSLKFTSSDMQIC